MENVKHVYVLSSDSFLSHALVVSDPIDKIDLIYSQLLSDIRFHRKIKNFKGHVQIYVPGGKRVRLTKATLLDQIVKQTEKNGGLYIIISSNILKSSVQVKWTIQRTLIR